MSFLPKARIISLGCYLPEKILSNSDLEKIVDTSDEWIVSRSGISERRIASTEEFPSTMGAAAAKQALERSSLKPGDIELVIVATMTSDYVSSSTAALVQHAIGAKKAAAFDVQAACSGFLYALATAKAYVESGMYNHVVVVAAEKMSAFIDYTDRNTCVLFGDGAAAAVVSNCGPGLLIGSTELAACGEMVDLLRVPSGGSRDPATSDTVAKRQHYIKMNGKEIFKNAVRLMTVAARQCLAKSGLAESDVDWLVPHQANVRIIDAIAKNFNISPDKIYKTVHKYGNTSASAVAIALNELLLEQNIQEGDNLLLIAFGAGLTWGSILLTQTR